MDGDPGGGGFFVARLSAPIKVVFEQSESDQLKLLHWETNGFSKWEALQRVSLKHLTHPDIPKAEAPNLSPQDVYQQYFTR